MWGMQRAVEGMGGGQGGPKNRRCGRLTLASAAIPEP